MWTSVCVYRVHESFLHSNFNTLHPLRLNIFNWIFNEMTVLLSKTICEHSRCWIQPEGSHRHLLELAPCMCWLCVIVYATRFRLSTLWKVNKSWTENKLKKHYNLRYYAMNSPTMDDISVSPKKHKRDRLNQWVRFTDLKEIRRRTITGNNESILVWIQAL